MPITANTYTQQKGLKSKIVQENDSIPPNTVLIDVISPTLNEKQLLENGLGIVIPSREELEVIEVMSPFYKSGEHYYMTLTAVQQVGNDEYWESTALTFILTPTCLVMLHHDDIYALKNFFDIHKNHINFDTSPEVLLIFLLDLVINHVASILEKAGGELDRLLKILFEKSDPRAKSDNRQSRNHYNDIIKKIGRNGNLISKNRESLVSINRLIIYYNQVDEIRSIPIKINRKEHRLRIKHLAREILSLSEYANFLSQRNAFLLDATLGMISVEQNVIIKAFTVAAAVFMPPTLIASIYGMNFVNMPELSWSLGYPLALLLIVISAIIPYLFFKRKGWL